MKGDFTRDSFDPMKCFTRVMMQQGRPQLDADWNEQVAIFWEFWRNFTSDLLGPHAGPEWDCGFWILADGDFPLPKEAGITIEEQKRLRDMLQRPGDFLIGPGHYYVDGMRCSNPRWVTYSNQPETPGCTMLEKNHHGYLVYLDVWERHITHVEDESIREVALIGADSCTRAKLVWQVRSFELRREGKGEQQAIDCGWVKKEWTEIVHHWQARHRGRLRARAGRGTEVPSLEPSVVSPASSYRGPSNQLYRVEIHRGGGFAEGDIPTFKYSRENGSVVFPVLNLAGPVVTVGHVGRDAGSSLQAGDWVELVDDDYVLQNRAEPLRQVEKIDSVKMQVTLKGQAASTVGENSDKHPLLRRWEQKQGDPKKGGLELHDGAAVVKEAEEDRFWLGLENGVQIQFRKSEPPNHYRTGDYWLIPARTASGDVQWPSRDGELEALGPRGVRHHYAPLAIVSFEGQDVLEAQSDCRSKFQLTTKY
jgi:hypothetical protein